MNLKLVLMMVAIVAVIAGGFFLPVYQTALAPSPSATTTGNPVPTTVKKSSEPTFSFGTTTVSSVLPYAYVDSATLVSDSRYPTITGTANVAEVGIVIYTEAGAGIVGTGGISVIDGHWTYSVPVALTPGYYKVVVGGGAAATTAILHIN